MTDKIDAQRRSANMRAIKSKGTKPEMAVRKLVHALGYRYRLHRRDLPGNPDLVFVGRRKAIFVHGCFWHQHPDCREGRPPRSNSAYWTPKLARNVERDRLNEAELIEAGWSVLTIWECQTSDRAAMANLIRKFLG